MQDVGPTSYETLNKKVAFPANLLPNLGPTPIKIDSRDIFMHQQANKTPSKRSFNFGSLETKVVEALNEDDPSELAKRTQTD